MDPSEVKLLDFAKTKEVVAGSRMKLLRAYQNKFFFNKGKQGSVIFHVILATGIIGYSLEYDHLTNLENLDLGLVIQEIRVFSETPLKAKKCELVLMKLLYLIYNGTKLTEQDATTVFFAITKTFQSKEPHLRRLTYLVIRELSKTAQDVLIVTSSLTQDMVGKGEYFFRTGSVRALGSIIDASMLASLERFFKQAFLDTDRLVAAASLATIYHFAAENAEPVKRWSSEIVQYVSSGSSKSICQYLALGILFLSRQSDRVSLMKIFQQVPMNSNSCTLVLFLRIYSFLIQLKPAIPGFTVLDLKPYLRMKSKNEMVAIEAARVICELHWLYERDLSFAVTALQSFLSSSSCVVRFSSMKILNQLASKNPSGVSGCNVEIESLLTDSNRTVATLAVTTLLKTGTENSIDRLIKQMSSFVSEISDEFKSIVVDAVKTLCLKFPAKYSILIEFLGSILREEGGYEYKRKTVESICEILNSIPESREIGLIQLCEFIEDCEYPKLTAKIIYLIGNIGPASKNASELIRYIYNRLILENTMVRVACVGALSKFAIDVPESRQDIVKILRNKCCIDPEDEVRDRAIVSLALISKEIQSENLICYYDPIALELALLEAKTNYTDIAKVPQASFFKTLETSAQKPETINLNDSDDSKQITCDTKITQLPGFNSLGPLIYSGNAKILNDSDAECHIAAISHIFKNHVAVEFICKNTIPHIVMENVEIKTSLSSDQDIKVLKAFPVASLKYNCTESSFLVLGCASLMRPLINFDCTVNFAFRDFDETLNVCTGPPTFESFKLNTFEMSFTDYVQPLRLVSFNEAWSSEKFDASASATFELPSLESIQDSVDLLVDTFGGKAFDNSDRIIPSATVHSLSIGGLLLTAKAPVPFLVKCRIALVSQCIALEIHVKSPDQSVCDLVIGQVQ